MAAWQVREWEWSGRALPIPAAAKRREIRRYAKAAGIRVLVETGTYRGDTVEALRRNFDAIYSCELDADHFARARDRFARYDHIAILHGDSGSVLADIVSTIDRTCLFWLDAHYSGGDTARGERDTPIEKELHLIFSKRDQGDVILIDDASDFVGDNDYPTVDELREVIARERPGWTFQVRDNIIRAHPPLNSRRSRS